MRKKYDKEFKRETVKMIQEQGKPVAQVARELELSDNTLYRWMSEFKKDSGNAFRGSGNLKVEDKNQADLQKRIRQLEMENDILKKAMHIFAKDQK
ncbi:transposase [Paenibacillus sp. 1_12]|nr:transposase [Paenibacillus sp. 1_12]